MLIRVFFIINILSFSCIRNSKIKRRTLSGLRFHPDFPTVTLDDFFAYCKAYAGSGVFFPAVQALKNQENLLGVLWFNPYAVIGY